MPEVKTTENKFNSDGFTTENNVGYVTPTNITDIGNRYMSALQSGDRKALARLMELYLSLIHISEPTRPY